MLDILGLIVAAFLVTVLWSVLSENTRDTRIFRSKYFPADNHNEIT